METGSHCNHNGKELTLCSGRVVGDDLEKGDGVEGTVFSETMGKQVSGEPWTSAMPCCPRVHHPIGGDQPQRPRAAWEEAQ